MNGTAHRFHSLPGICLTILGLCAFASACDRPLAPEEALSRARSLVAEQQPEAAEVALKEALDAGAVSRDLSLQLAELQMNRGEFAAAIRTLENGLERFSSDLEIATMLGIYLVENGEFERADTVLSPVLERRQEPRTRFYRARAREALGRRTEALEDYRAALGLDPGWYSPHYRLAQLLEASGETDSAAFHRSEFERLRGIENEIESLAGQLEASDTDSALWLELAKAYFRQGRTREAATSLESALARDPASADLNEYLGDLLLALGRDAEARQAYERSLRLDERRGLTWLKLGDLDYSHQEMVSAEASYRRALATASDFWPAMNNLAWLLLEQGRGMDEAMSLATRAAEIHPADLTLDTLAMAHFLSGNLTRSKELIDRVIEMSPDHPEFQAHRDQIHGSPTEP